MNVTFLLNGEKVEVDTHPTQTLLDYLREVRGLTGTKEGCNDSPRRMVRFILCNRR